MIHTPLFPPRIIRRTLLVVACLCVFVSPLYARSWRIANFNDTIIVGGDGSAMVSERITLVFVGEFQGIHRTIPVEYPGPRGTNFTLFLDVTSVSDGEGHKLKYESHTSGGYRDLKIFLPDANNTTETVEVSYSVRNAVRF